MMQQFATTHAMRDKIIQLAQECGLQDDDYLKMLDYTIDLFQTQGLGTDYYGYHNINHELEVTYATLLFCKYYMEKNEITDNDARYMYVAALFHDFDPQKSVDKPHEENVINFITTDENLLGFLGNVGIDVEIVKVLILRTTYPWRGRAMEDAQKAINRCLDASATGDPAMRNRALKLGWFLSIIDRMAGYALGDFAKSMELAKMNAHASAWHPSVIVRSSVGYFEDLLNSETKMSQYVMTALPQQMRRNFFGTVQSFMALRQQEIKIQADYVFENLRFIPMIEKTSAKKSPDFVKSLLSIYDELPRPLQFMRENFEESITRHDFILNTLRLDSPDGKIIGFAKGGPLEAYDLRPQIRDQNHGLNNTMFLEPIALKMGYWGMRGGSEMRHMFVMQAHTMNYDYVTSFAQRNVIQKRIDDKQRVEFVTLFDPERWDYYRMTL